MRQVYDLEEQEDDAARETWMKTREQRRGRRRQWREDATGRDAEEKKALGTPKAGELHNSTAVAESGADSAGAEDDRAEEAEDLEDEEKQGKLKDGRDYRRSQCDQRADPADRQCELDLQTEATEENRRNETRTRRTTFRNMRGNARVQRTQRREEERGERGKEAADRADAKEDEAKFSLLGKDDDKPCPAAGDGKGGKGDGKGGGKNVARDGKDGALAPYPGVPPGGGAMAGLPKGPIDEKGKLTSLEKRMTAEPEVFSSEEEARIEKNARGKAEEQLLLRGWKRPSLGGGDKPPGKESKTVEEKSVVGLSSVDPPAASGSVSGSGSSGGSGGGSGGNLQQPNYSNGNGS